MWEYSPQNRQNWYFLYEFAQKGKTPLSDFLKKIGLGEGVPGLHPHAKFHLCGCKNVGLPFTAPKSRKICP